MTELQKWQGMTRHEFAKMVDYLTDRFTLPMMDGWVNVYNDFATIPSEHVWGALLAKLDNPTIEFPPKAPAVAAAARERMRDSLRHQPRILPAPQSEQYGWAEYSMETYGKHLSFTEAIERAAEAHRAKETRNIPT